MSTGSLEENRLGVKRVFFTLDEGVSANVALPMNGSKVVPVTVLSISDDSIGFLGTRCKLPRIGVGDHLILRDIHAPQPLGTIDKAEVSVTYVIDDEIGVRLSYGCDFVKLPPPQCTRINEFIKKRLKILGITH